MPIYIVYRRYLLAVLFFVLVSFAGCSFLNRATPTNNGLSNIESTNQPLSDISLFDATPTTTQRKTYPMVTTESRLPSIRSDAVESSEADVSIVSIPTAPVALTQITNTLPSDNSATPTEMVSTPPVETTLTPDPTPTRLSYYVFPIQPPEVAWFIDGHRNYPATDIVAPFRAAFVAVTDGVVDDLSRVDLWNPDVNDPSLRAGKYVSLIGDDGVRYYGSHLDEVAAWISPGMRVSAGTIIGFVGNSGNARGLAHHLHFGISRPTFAGDWEVRRGQVSPYPYLQAWLQGEMLKPDLSSSEIGQ